MTDPCLRSLAQWYIRSSSVLGKSKDNLSLHVGQYFTVIDMIETSSRTPIGALRMHRRLSVSRQNGDEALGQTLGLAQINQTRLLEDRGGMNE